MPVQFGFSPVAVYFGRVFVQGPRSRTLAAGFLNADWLTVAAGFSSYLSFLFPALAFLAGHGLLVLPRRVALVADLGALPGERDHRAQHPS